MKIGVIGGSGMDNPQILEDYKEHLWETPFGAPSDKLISGSLVGREVVILARHGKNHTIMPTKVPYRANIWALKEIGCTHILATTACGSLKDEFKPSDFVFLDQFIDFTKHRNLTFYDDKVIHTPMAEPFDSNLRKSLVRSAQQLNYSFHEKGTVITIEGPRFSSKAESNLFRSWGVDVINMSTVPEVILANELGIPYQSIAMVTDYDCWKEGEASVTIDLVFERMKSNANRVTKLLIETIKNL